MKHSLLLLAVLANIQLFFAQNIRNNLSGVFEDTTQESLYPKFEFDNNGKVNIADFTKGDYFIKGDSLIVFPDKDIFKFIIKPDRIIGVSEWVQDGVWTRKDTIANNNRTNDALAQNQAELLHDFYQKTRMGINQMDMLFDESLQKKYTETLEGFCNKNLVRACKEFFGMVTLEEMGGTKNMFAEDKPTIKESKKLIEIAEKIKTIDPAEGHYMLSLYYNMTNQPEKATTEINKAIELGNQEAVLKKMEIEINKTDD